MQVINSWEYLNLAALAKLDEIQLINSQENSNLAALIKLDEIQVINSQEYSNLAALVKLDKMLAVIEEKKLYAKHNSVRGLYFQELLWFL